MSSFVYQQGGSGGGGAYASIFVKGLTAESSVSAETTATRKVPNPEYVVPDGYTQLEYIESSGTQYIDTGVVLDATTYAQMRQVVVEQAAWSTGWYINGVGTAGRCWFNGAYHSTIYYGSGYSNQATSESLLSNTKVRFDLDFPNSTYQVEDLTNNTTRLSLTPLAKQAPSSAYTLWLFGYNGDKGLHSGKIFSAQYYQSDVLIRDFIPAKRNSDGAIGMYDLVTQTFYVNSGTGTFVAGEEIPRYFEEPYGVLLKGAWNERIVPNPEYVVPDGYTQLEYIESTGTQYINTGVTTENGIHIAVKFTPTYLGTGSSEYFHVFTSEAGISGGNKGFGFLYHPAISPNFMFSSGGYNNPITNLSIGEWYDCVGKATLSEAYARVNGVEYAVENVGNYFTAYPLYLFCENYQGTARGFAKIKVENAKAYDPTTGELIRNFVPAKRNSDGVLGMYDLVTNTFYVNSGSGNFIAGAEVPKEFDESGFLIAPIRNLGMWTVTATDYELTKTQDVLIDVVAAYTIEMYIRLWLYREGYVCEDVTGGYSAQSVHINGGTDVNEGYLANPSITFNPDNMSISQNLDSSNRNTVGQTVTNNLISLANYTKLKIHVVSASIYTANAGSQHINAIFAKSKSSGYSDAAGVNIVHQSGNGTTDTKENVVVEGDISSLTGNYYFLILTRSIGSLVVDKIWLE